MAMNGKHNGASNGCSPATVSDDDAERGATALDADAYDELKARLSRSDEDPTKLRAFFAQSEPVNR